MNLAELILDLHINCLAPLRAIAAKNNLSISQLLCILCIPYNGITQSNLAKKLSLDISTLSRNLNKMINKNIIMKNITNTDKRIHCIYLTEYGKLLYSQINIDLEEKLLSIYQQMNLDDIESLSLGVEKLNWQLMKKTL